MIWIETPDKCNLLECSKFKIVQKTPTQFLILNQNVEILGEYHSKEEAIDVLYKIKEAICNNKIIFSMPNFKTPTNF